MTEPLNDYQSVPRIAETLGRTTDAVDMAIQVLGMRPILRIDQAVYYGNGQLDRIRNECEKWGR